MARRAQSKQTRGAVRIGLTSYGRGVFARRRFREGETIAEIHGEIISDPDYGSDYCIALSGPEVLEPASPFCYLNHHCQPNCELAGESRWDDKAGALQHNTWLMALSDVAPGEQLTIDYAWPAAWAIPCKCGSSTCRGWIVADDQQDQLPSVQA